MFGSERERINVIVCACVIDRESEREDCLSRKRERERGTVIESEKGNEQMRKMRKGKEMRKRRKGREMKKMRKGNRWENGK
jgi:hypothetical protein